MNMMIDIEIEFILDGVPEYRNLTAVHPVYDELNAYTKLNKGFSMSWKSYQPIRQLIHYDQDVLGLRPSKLISVYM